MLSIIIPVYNVEKYLKRCIESILRQSFSDWELLLIDDGSSDRSGDICDYYSKRYEKITVYHQKNKGVSAARNVGIDHAKGSHIIFIDSDDFIDKDMFYKMMSGNCFDMVVCDYKKVYESKQYKVETFGLWKSYNEKSFDVKKKYYDVLCRTGTLWNKIIHRSVIGNVRFDTNQTYGEDSVFLTKILKRVDSVHIVKQPLYYYLCDRIGNVVTSDNVDSISDFIRNSIQIYCILRKEGFTSCGVYKIQKTVWDVLKKCNNESKNNEKIISKCYKAMRTPTFMEIIKYIFDGNIPIPFKSRLSFFKYVYYMKC